MFDFDHWYLGTEVLKDASFISRSSSNLTHLIFTRFRKTPQAFLKEGRVTPDYWILHLIFQYKKTAQLPLSGMTKL